ncbi:MAG: agmatinase family protein [Planctomycetota bacterium]
MSERREDFDPGGPGSSEDGIYGLGTGPEESRIHLIPVPFEATTSYRRGTAGGPAAILEASVQVDLYDIDNGRPYEAGICLLPERPEIAAANERVAAAAERVIEAQGVVGDDPSLAADLEAVNAASALVNGIVREEAERVLAAGRIPAVVGGDHACPFGLIEALAARHPGLGVLHVDAHHDLRDAYEGFTWSHASIMHNVAERLGGVARIVQVGIRDFSEDEAQYMRASDRRIVTFYDGELRKAQYRGTPFDAIARTIVSQLPYEVHVSFDIDGLDPKLCPNTGTPVPGGLEFEEAVHLLRVLRESGRRIVGFDLCEVAPGADEWDANVGARILYKLCGFAL